MASIAFPVLGTGVLGSPIEEVARIMLQVIADFSEGKPSSSIEDVYIVVYKNPDHIVVGVST